MLAEACEEMARHRQQTESYWPQGKGPQAQGKAWDEDVDKSKGHEDRKMSDKTGGETEAGCDDQCFRCGGLHRTSQCPAPGDHKINTPTDKTMDKRGRPEQAEFQMKLAILQKINPRIARKPGLPRKKRPRKSISEDGQEKGMLQPQPNDRPWLTGKDGSQQQVIFRDIFRVTAGRLQGKEDLDASEASAG